MINTGKREVYVDAGNDWTVYTMDDGLSAQIEYMVLITEMVQKFLQNNNSNNQGMNRMLKLLIPWFYYSRIMLFLYLQDTVSFLTASVAMLLPA